MNYRVEHGESVDLRRVALAKRRIGGRTTAVRRVIGALSAASFAALLVVPQAMFPSGRPWVLLASIALAYAPVIAYLPRVSMSQWSVVPMLVVPFANLVTVYHVAYRASLLPARDWMPLTGERDRILEIAKDFYVLI
jgi:hypothetical protein